LSGGLGGYTIFSPCQHETGTLVMDGELGYAALNMVLSVAAGFVALKPGDVIANLV